MAESNRQMTMSRVAGADLTGAQYTIVRFSAAGEVNIASNAAALSTVGAIGVLENKPNSGQSATVVYLGESKVVAGAAVTAGAFVTTNGSGRAVAAGSGDLAVGRALTASGADGEIFRALVFPAMRLGGAA